MKSSASASSPVAASHLSSTALSSIFGSMGRLWAVICMLIVLSSVISARPANMIRQKRQSDQRLAELETLLALQKYNGHRVRGWQSHNDLTPGFGLIDFDKIGRRKKSTSFSPRVGPDGESAWNTWVSKAMGSRSFSSLDSQFDQK